MTATADTESRSRPMGSAEAKSVEVASLAAFLRQFHFRAANRGAIGIEREFFIVDDRGRPVPRCVDVLGESRRLSFRGWDPELSACQIEVKTPPRFRNSDLARDLRRQEDQGRRAAAAFGLDLSSMELAPDDMPLDVFPDPRYRDIAARLDRDTLLVACQLAATHIHIGVGSMAEAFIVYSRLRRGLAELIREGDHSGRERLRRYARMAPNFEPPVLEDVRAYFALAVTQGFARTPRTAKDCWWLLRINPVGTVEIRVFGAESNHQKILRWVDIVRAQACVQDLAA